MRLIGTSSETFSQPPQPVERSYRCPRCEAEWTFNADFRVAKSTHIPDCQPHRFSRNVDALCEVIFHPIGPNAIPLLRGHHRIITSRGRAELPGRRVQWLSPVPRDNGENTSH
jgi:hypothetical protein